MHIKQPSNHNVKIWRYLDFVKFMSMLDQNALFFSNLSDLDDPNEGVMPNSVREKYRHYFRNAAKKTDQTLPLSLSAERFAQSNYIEFLKYSKRYRKLILVNSWHMSEDESAFMWELYSHINKGIAIQSTYKKLDEALKINENYNYTQIGIVEYKDSKNIKDNTSLKDFVFTKRNSFRHENELRAILELPYGKVYSIGKKVTKKNYQTNEVIFHKEKAIGRHLKVDLGLLIEKIFLSPRSKRWFKDLVISILKKYELDVEPEISDLYTLK